MERKFTLKVSKVVGTPSDGFWSQVHTFFPEDQEKKEKRGDLLAVLVLAGVPEGIEAVAAGREVLGRLHEEYYGNLEGSPFERITSAIGKITQENQDIEIIAAVLFDKVLYLAIYGEGRVCLKRGDQFGTILKGNEELQTASGILEENDLIIIGSKKFFGVVGDGVLKASLEGSSTEGAVEALAPIILGHNDMAAAAAILALTQKNEPLEIQPVFSQEQRSPINTESAVETKETNESATFKKRIKRLLLERKLLKRRAVFEGKRSEERPSQRPIFVRKTAQEKKKKAYFIAALCLLALLGVSIIFGNKKRLEKQKISEASQILSQAEEKLNQGKMVSLDNPNEGRVLGIQAQNLLQEAAGITENNEEAIFLREQINKFLDSLGQEHYLNEQSVFMDLSLIKDGASGVSFALLGKKLAILDQKEEKIYFLDSEKKSHQVFDLNEEGSLVTSSTGKIFVFGTKGVFEIKENENKAGLIIEKDGDWGRVVGISSFNSNVYLLDKDNTVWRYLYSEGGYGDKKSWFVGNPPDLSGAVSMAIDSSIWILEGRKIRRFNLGKQEPFSLQKMPDELKGSSKIYTSEEEENLYVLDKEAGKLFVIEKTGNFKSVYVSEKFKEANDIIAVESSKKLFILAGTRIYEAALK